ncbi:type IV secretion system protein [Candidatus Peregrinibacteria bacterium]|nr:MAG: type IV secretion system protein [Candidatus Peregrinibacteria bacterium]
MIFNTRAIHRLVVGVLAGLAALVTVNAFAQEITVAPVVGADPSIFEMTASNSNPTPGSLSTLQVDLHNYGTLRADNLSLVIDYDEAVLQDVSLLQPDRCQDSGREVTCFIPTLMPGASASYGFSVKLSPTLTIGSELRVTSRLTASADVDASNNVGSVPLFVSSFQAGSPNGLAPGTTASGLLFGTELPAGESATHQGIVVFDVENDPYWQPSTALTVALKFLIRGKETLAWRLGMESEHSDTLSVESAYHQVLSVINSLFIVALLIIAALWMFSLFIPRHYLRQVVLLFVAAVLLVNFSLPITRLFIQGAHLLQSTFLANAAMIDLVDTPLYQESASTVYRSIHQVKNTNQHRRFSWNLPPESTTPTVIATLESAESTGPDWVGTVQGVNGTAITQESIELRSTGNPQSITLNPSGALELTATQPFNPTDEQVGFMTFLIGLNGLAYFSIALIFMLRVVILWLLMVVSPVLFLLVIFRGTRAIFFQWLRAYGRWILIGPLLAVGLSFMSGVWQQVGIPLSSGYRGMTDFGLVSNVGFYLPGSSQLNHLSTSAEMMQYLVFLLMLFSPIVVAFMLTRSQTLNVIFAPIATGWNASGSVKAIPHSPAPNPTPPPTHSTGVGSLKSSLSQFIPSFGRVTASRELPSVQPELLQASGYLPHHLALASTGDLLGLASGTQESRHKRERAVHQLAQVDSMSDGPEKVKMQSVYHELDRRANDGNTEAIEVMNEIRAVATTVPSAPSSEPATPPSASPRPNSTAFTTPILKEEAPINGAEVRPILPTETPNHRAKEQAALLKKADELIRENEANDSAAHRDSLDQ